MTPRPQAPAAPFRLPEGGWRPACLLALLALLWSGPAMAHAVLLSASPADGSSLGQPPDRLTLRFSEPVGVLALALERADGAPVGGTGAAASADGVITVPLPPLPRGSYVARYRVASADGHAVAGALAFGIGMPASAAAGPPAGADPLAAGFRIVQSASLLAAIGLGLFAGLVAPLRLAPAALAALALVLAGIGLRGSLLTAGGLAGLADPASWAAGWGAAGGAALAAAAGLLMMLAGGVLPGAGLAALSFALAGHAAALEPRWLAGPAIVAHVLAAAFWLGGLIALPGRLEPRLVRRFSALALGAVPVLLLSGLASLAWRLLGAVALASPYGMLALAKLAGFAVLLGLAAWNRLRLTDRLEKGDAAPLRRSIAVERALFAAVLGLAAVLSQTPPPRQPPGGPVVVVVAAPGRIATLAIGPQGVTAAVAGPDGTAIPGIEAALRWWPDHADAAPRTAAMRADRHGGWRLDMPLGLGAGRMRLDLLVDDFTKASFEARYALPAGGG
ncbi:MAG: hypothetical protein OHK0024_04420 [Thalassobaculales bacterium]